MKLFGSKNNIVVLALGCVVTILLLTQCPQDRCETKIIDYRDLPVAIKDTIEDLRTRGTFPEMICMNGVDFSRQPTFFSSFVVYEVIKDNKVGRKYFISRSPNPIIIDKDYIYIPNDYYLLYSSTPLNSITYTRIEVLDRASLLNKIVGVLDAIYNRRRLMEASVYETNDYLDKIEGGVEDILFVIICLWVI